MAAPTPIDAGDLEHQSSPLFSERENVTLSFASDAASVPNALTDASYDELARHWPEEIVEILGARTARAGATISARLPFGIGATGAYGYCAVATAPGVGVGRDEHTQLPRARTSLT